MTRARFTLGTRVLVQPDGAHEPIVGLIADGPLLIAAGPFFKVRTDELAYWYPVEQISPYLHLVKADDGFDVGRSGVGRSTRYRSV